MMMMMMMMMMMTTMMMMHVWKVAFGIFTYLNTTLFFKYAWGASLARWKCRAYLPGLLRAPQRSKAAPLTRVLGPNDVVWGPV
jgi:membrane protein required for beta-lactamase induction